MNDHAVPLAAKTAEGKENAPELAALEASFVAFATTSSTIEYTTESAECQAIATPSFDEIEAAIANVARQRIEAAHHELQDTRGRLERERTARDRSLNAAQERVSQAQAALDGLADERAAIEQRARAFLGGDTLQTMLGKIHLAFNARQLELEDALAIAKSDTVEAQTEMQAASVSDVLELQLAEQELERLESAAPEVAQKVRLAASAEENLATARQAVKNGLLRDAVVLLDQAKAGNADPTQIAEVEQALTEAKQAQTVGDLITRMATNAERPGAVRRIRKLMEEAEQARVSTRIASSAERALQIARYAANQRFAQARLIADRLAKEGLVPVVADGRIEVWKQMARSGRTIHRHSHPSDDRSMIWKLERVMVLRDSGKWVSETLRVPLTCKETPPRVQHSRWFRTASVQATPY